MVSFCPSRQVMNFTGIRRNVNLFFILALTYNYLYSLGVCVRL